MKDFNWGVSQSDLVAMKRMDITGPTKYGAQRPVTPQRGLLNSNRAKRASPKNGVDTKKKR